MAKQDGGLMGGFSGRIGNMVGYQWNGRWCVRSRQQMVRNPRTEAQTRQRDLFKEEVRLAARMRWAVATALTQRAREVGMTAYNLFVHCNQGAFAWESNQLAVDYASLRLSVGIAAAVEPTELAWSSEGVLTAQFEKSGGSAFDMVYLYAYAPELGQGFLAAPVYRRAKKVEVLLPEVFAGHEVVVYLMVQRSDGEWSETAYAGCVAVGERVSEEVEEEAVATSENPRLEAGEPQTMANKPLEADDVGGGVNGG